MVVKSVRKVISLYLLHVILHRYNSCTIVKPVYYHLVSDLNISSTQFGNLENGELKLFLRKSRETASKVSRICCSSTQSVLGFDRDTFPFAPTTQNESHGTNQEFVEAIILVFNVQSTYLENGF
jgi:hypothetical protein